MAPTPPKRRSTQSKPSPPAARVSKADAVPRAACSISRGGQLAHINGTPVRLMQACHTAGVSTDGAFALGTLVPAAPPLPVAAYRAAF